MREREREGGRESGGCSLAEAEALHHRLVLERGGGEERRGEKRRGEERRGGAWADCAMSLTSTLRHCVRPGPMQYL